MEDYRGNTTSLWDWRQTIDGAASAELIRQRVLAAIRKFGPGNEHAVAESAALLIWTREIELPGIPAAARFEIHELLVVAIGAFRADQPDRKEGVTSLAVLLGFLSREPKKPMSSKVEEPLSALAVDHNDAKMTPSLKSQVLQRLDELEESVARQGHHAATESLIAATIVWLRQNMDARLTNPVREQLAQARAEVKKGRLKGATYAIREAKAAVSAWADGPKDVDENLP